MDDISCPIQNLAATATAFNLKCALECSRLGSALIILDKDGYIYVPISASMPDQDQRSRLLPFVSGFFAEWDCGVTECELASGDVLVIYTDGITEAGPNEEEEFGEERLIATAQKHSQQSAIEILNNTVAEVQPASRGRQAADMTLIVAGCA